MLAGNGPSPEIRSPLPNIQRLGFLRQFITRPTIIVGDYTYYDDPRGPKHSRTMFSIISTSLEIA